MNQGTRYIIFVLKSFFTSLLFCQVFAEGNLWEQLGDKKFKYLFKNIKDELFRLLGAWP